MAQTTQIKKLLDRKIRKIETAKTSQEPPKCLYDVYARLSPDLEPPRHLDPYVELLDKAVFHGDVQACFHAPPQHGKTLAASHAFVELGMVRPGLWSAYSTYSVERAKQIRDHTRDLAKIAGLNPKTQGAYLRFDGGSQIKFCGASTGMLTGEKVNGLHVIDDPIKDRKEAVSATVRESLWNWLFDVAQTRRHPNSSVLVMMTRWHSDDLVGRIIKHLGWTYLRLAAECDSTDDPLGREIGKALWEAMRPSEWLQQFKASPLTWASMYQGRPRPVGDVLFGEPVYYDRLPSEGAYRQLYGADLAYSEKTRADWSVLLGARLYDQKMYLTSGLWRQVQADKFTDLMAGVINSKPGQCLWYGATTERGTAQLIRKRIPSFQFRRAVGDKYVRALPTAELLWNQGRILVPSGAPWVDRFVHVMSEFTGQNDVQDDEVDALAALGDLALRYDTPADVGALNRLVRDRLRGSIRRI